MDSRDTKYMEALLKIAADSNKEIEAAMQEVIPDTLRIAHLAGIGEGALNAYQLYRTMYSDLGAAVE